MASRARTGTICVFTWGVRGEKRWRGESFEEVVEDTTKNSDEREAPVG